MPKSIPGEHVERMFPFDFFEELSEQMKEYRFLNAAFAIHERNPIDIKSKKHLFEQVRREKPITALYGVNIMPVEPFGDVLLLDLCMATDELNTIFSADKTAYSQSPITIMIVQLYDRKKKPIFTTTQDESIIATIPEVLWDDPNLMISMLIFEEDGAKVAILKAPNEIIEEWTEPVESYKDRE